MQTHKFSVFLLVQQANIVVKLLASAELRVRRTDTAERTVRPKRRENAAWKKVADWLSSLFALGRIVSLFPCIVVVSRHSLSFVLLFHFSISKE